MPYLTLTENQKLQLNPGLAAYDVQPGNGAGLFWDKHTHVYLLTYLPQTHTVRRFICVYVFVFCVFILHITVTQWGGPGGDEA